MGIDSGMSRPQDAATSAATQFSKSAGCSPEQIFTPVSISKGSVPAAVTPGFRPPMMPTNQSGPFGINYEGNGAVPYNQTPNISDDSNTVFSQHPSEDRVYLSWGSIGPTNLELNPYFPNIFGDDGTSFFYNCDYNVVVADGATDLNQKKNSNREYTRRIRTQGLRAPVILSGWGFDVADMPVPSLNYGRSFDPNLINNRAYWKTGPLHVMWDDERQVWTGSHQIVCGYLKSTRIEAPTDKENPTLFKVSVLRRIDGMVSENNPNFGSRVSSALNSSTPNPWTEGDYASLSTNLGEEIVCVNRNTNFYMDPADPSSIFVVAIRLNYEWVPLWISPDASGMAIGRFEGTWNKGSYNTVTQIAPTTQDTITANVLNLFADVGGDTSSTCAYVNIGNVKYLIAAECTE